MSATQLAVGGMTCASCAARIEKKLNRLEGVRASVNYATETAVIDHPSTIAVAHLIETVEASGYTASRTPPDQDAGDVSFLGRRVIISALLTLPVLVLSMTPPLQFRGWQWVALAFATPVVTWGALPLHRATWTNLRHRATTMDTLISLGVLAAYAWSVWAMLLGAAGDLGMRMSFSLGASADDDIYLEVACAVTVFVLAGRYAEARAKHSSGAALRALLTLGAKDVAVLRDGREVRLPVAQLEVGDRFAVRPGEKIATDGVVVAGTSAVDESLVTGESVPVEVVPGSAVVGAGLNAGGRLIVRATRVGADTRLAQLARLVQQAQTGKAPVQRLADRVSAVFVPVVIGLSLVTFLGWLAFDGSVHAAFSAAIAVLIIACPCALGLATPTALLVGTGRGAQLGIVIRGPQVLESTRLADTVVLDKTGTVTTGVMTLHGVSAESPSDVLRLAGAVEDASEHPIGAAIAAAARETFGDLPAVSRFANTTGLGVRGVVEGRTVVVGRHNLVGGAGDSAIAAAVERVETAGRTAVVVGWDGRSRGVLDVGDSVKATSAEAVRELRALGLRPVLVTGDNHRAARSVAVQVGIDEVIAGALPADKVTYVARLHAEGHVVAMIGDGVNDAAALAAADLGVALGGGADVAIEAADLTLVRGDLRVAADAIRLSRATLQTIKVNLFWAFAYNVAALPVAALGLLNPVIAGAAMAASSVFVVTNSLRLRHFRPLSR